MYIYVFGQELDLAYFRVYRMLFLLYLTVIYVDPHAPSQVNLSVFVNFLWKKNKPPNLK